MRKLIGVLVAGVLVVGVTGIALADDIPNFTFGASTSYVFDINQPPDNLTPAPLNSATYANKEGNDESFNIDLIQIGISGERGVVGYGAKLDFGDLAKQAGDTEGGNNLSLQEAFIAYDAQGVTVTAGRFATPFGYEVLEPWGNAHISRSWAWTAQPINHDGLTLSGNANGIDVMVGVINNFSVAGGPGNDQNDEKGVVGSVGTAVQGLSVQFAGLFTQGQDRNMPSRDVDKQAYNLVISGDAGELDYGIEGNYRNDDPDNAPDLDFWNVGLYLGSDFGPTSLDVRWDYTDNDGVDLGSNFLDFNSQIWSVTVTAGWELADGVAFRVEYRHDDANDPIFVDDSAAGVDDTLDTVQAQVIWHP